MRLRKVAKLVRGPGAVERVGTLDASCGIGINDVGS